MTERLFEKNDDYNPGAFDARGTKYASTMGTSFYTEKGSELNSSENPIEKHKKRVLKKVITS